MTPQSLRPQPPAATGWGRLASSTNAILLADGVVGLIGVAILAALSAFFDERVATAVAGLPPTAVATAGLVSEWGKSGYMFALAALVFAGSVLARRSARLARYGAALAALRERSLYVFCVLATSGLLAQGVKHLIGRARPPLMSSFGPYFFDLLSLKASYASFPSGHSTTVFAMAVALSPMMPRARWPLFSVAVLVAASRVVNQAHYVSDVVAGGVLGVASALLVAWLFAGRSLAFDRDGVAIRVKGAGAVLRAWRGGPA